MLTDLPPAYKVQFALYMQFGARTLMLTGGNATGNQFYSGSLLSGGAPFDLNTFVDKILGAVFNLTLPASFPSITIDNLSANVTGENTPASTHLSVEKTVWSYEFNALSTTLVQQPFGEIVQIPVKFEGFSIALESAPGAAGNTLIFITTIKSTLTWLSAMEAKGQLVLISGSHAAAFFIHENISTAKLLHDLFQCTVPDDLAIFLPTFYAMSASQPMRLYYSSTDINTEQNGVTYNFQSGFNFDNCIVSILGMEFSICLQFTDAATYSFGASIKQINLGVLQIAAPESAGIVPNPELGGPVVQVQRQNQTTTINLQARLIFFSGADSFTLNASYTAATQTTGYTFNGSVQYDGAILGISNPTFGISWSKVGGLQITQFPIPESMLLSFIPFAEQLKDILNNTPGNACKQLVGFTFSKIITTRFKLNVKPIFSDGSPGLTIGGTYTVSVGGYDVCEISFEPFTATILMPKNFDDLGTAIINTLITNTTKLVQALVDDRVALIKFLAVQTLKTGLEDAASLICNVGGDQASGAAGDAGTTATNVAGGAANTLAAAAAIFSAATAALSIFAKILKCLTSSQKDEQRKAQERLEYATAKIQQLLTINNFTAYYLLSGNSITSTATWSALGVNDAAAYLTLNLTDAAGNVIFTSQNLTLDSSPTSCAPLTNLQPGKAYTLTLCGHYLYNNYTYDGLPVSQSMTINSLDINAPAELYDSASNSLTVKWSPTAGFSTPNGRSVFISYYTVVLWNLVTNAPVSGMSATVAGDTTAHTFNLLTFTPPPLLNNSYQVRLQGIANIAVFNSSVWQSSPFTVGAGIGHALLGNNFTVG